MRGLTLHANLAGADFLEACETAPRYRLYSIDNVHPGMFEVDTGGVQPDIPPFGGWRAFTTTRIASS
ncbi:MAG: allophanate hydrolase-related protein [Chloroflexota bacterium]